MTQSNEAERPMPEAFKDPHHLANAADAMGRLCKSWQGSTAEYHFACRDTISTQAARIAELEGDLQAALRREEDANRAAFAHMRRITALEADGIAARKATAKNYARAEAAEAEVARLQDYIEATAKATQKITMDLTDDAARLREALQRWQSYGCPDCGGDCASANPPVSCCIMAQTAESLK